MQRIEVQISGADYASVNKLLRRALKDKYHLCNKSDREVVAYFVTKDANASDVLLGALAVVLKRAEATIGASSQTPVAEYHASKLIELGKANPAQ